MVSHLCPSGKAMTSKESIFDAFVREKVHRLLIRADMILSNTLEQKEIAEANRLTRIARTLIRKHPRAFTIERYSPNPAPFGTPKSPHVGEVVGPNPREAQSRPPKRTKAEWKMGSLSAYAEGARNSNGDKVVWTRKVKPPNTPIDGTVTVSRCPPSWMMRKEKVR